MRGIVYVLTNEYMLPDVIKIGRTTRERLKSRLKSLSSHSGVPVPFTCEYAAEVEDAKKVEDTLKLAFKEERISRKREFFRTAPHKIITLLKGYATSDESVMVQDELDAITTPEEQQAIAEGHARRSNFRFSIAAVPVGAELVYVDDHRKKCKVLNDKKVEYKRKPYTLSGLATQFRIDAGYPTKGVQGAMYFLYEGELLNDRRNRLEAGE